MGFWFFLVFQVFLSDAFDESLAVSNSLDRVFMRDSIFPLETLSLALVLHTVEKFDKYFKEVTIHVFKTSTFLKEDFIS